MTNNTNNQEWWEREFNDEFWPLIPEGTDFDKSVKAFIRKVSKQSREDALKECDEFMQMFNYDFMGERREWDKYFDDLYTGKPTTSPEILIETRKAMIKTRRENVWMLWRQFFLLNYPPKQ